MGLISDGYRFIPTAKEQRATNGEMTIADQKVANGIYHHTIAGVLCSQLLPQALIGGANLLFNGSNSSGGNDKNYDASSHISEIKNIKNDIEAYKTLIKTHPDKAQTEYDNLVKKYDDSLDKSVHKTLNKFKENYGPKKKSS